MGRPFSVIAIGRVKCRSFGIKFTLNKEAYIPPNNIL